MPLPPHPRCRSPVPSRWLSAARSCAVGFPPGHGQNPPARYSPEKHRILAAEAQSLLDGFLPLVAAPLDFLQVTGKILLRGIVRRGTASLRAACGPGGSMVPVGIGVDMPLGLSPRPFQLLHFPLLTEPFRFRRIQSVQFLLAVAVLQLLVRLFFLADAAHGSKGIASSLFSSSSL